MMIQFSYIAFFGVVFPFMSLIFLIFNLVELRIDSIKLCHFTKRGSCNQEIGLEGKLTILK